MKPSFSQKDANACLKIARKTINLWLIEGEKYIPMRYPKALDEHGGVFTTIYTHPDHNLRGCIGYPEPFMPAIRSLINSAIHATKDSRFPNLTKEELNQVVVEVSLLTRPHELKVKSPAEYLKLIKIGKHGLIVRKWELSGLLLPQVAVKHGMDVEEFLQKACMKAALPSYAWEDPDTSVYTFESLIAREKKPPKKLEVV